MALSKNDFVNEVLKTESTSCVDGFHRPLLYTDQYSSVGTNFICSNSDDSFEGKDDYMRVSHMYFIYIYW